MIFALGLIMLAPAALAGQSMDETGASAGFRAGVWRHAPEFWPYGAASVDYRMSRRYTVDASYGVVSRPVVLCGDGVDDPMCEERKLIHIGTVGLRVQFGSNRMHPYAGGFAGYTWYYNRGSIFGLRAGLRLEAAESVDVLADGSVQATADGDSLGGSTAISVGASIDL